MKKLKKGSIRILLLISGLVIIVGLALYFNKDKILGSKVTLPGTPNTSNACVIQESRGNLIPLNVAQAVSLESIKKYYQPSNWIPVGHYPIYESSGSINYYAFIFRRPDFTKFTTLSSLEQNAALYSDKTSDQNEEKYQFSNITSIFTGSHEGDPLIDRHYKGIPEIIGKKIETKKYVENTYAGKTIGNIVMDFSMSKAYYEIVDKASNQPTGEVIGFDYVVTSIKKLADYKSEAKSRQYRSLNQDECDMYKQAIAQREAELKERWSEFTR